MYEELRLMRQRDYERELADLERVKKQLLWAYNDSGVMDAEMFISILRHEGYGHLVDHDHIGLNELAEEVSRKAVELAHAPQ